MNRNIDLTLNALFVGGYNSREKLQEHREYDAKHGVETRARDILGITMRESFYHGMGLVGDVRVRFENWYRRHFFDKEYTSPLSSGDDRLIARDRILGGLPEHLMDQIDPYARIMSGHYCDCCGRRLNLLIKSPECHTLCHHCDRYDDSPDRARNRIFNLTEDKGMLYEDREHQATHQEFIENAVAFFNRSKKRNQKTHFTLEAEFED